MLKTRLVLDFRCFLCVCVCVCVPVIPYIMGTKYTIPTRIVIPRIFDIFGPHEENSL